MTIRDFRQVERELSKQARRIGALAEEDRRLRERIAATTGISTPNYLSGTGTGGEVIAGDGLLGGGALPGAITLNVYPGYGIDIVSDQVIVDESELDHGLLGGVTANQHHDAVTLHADLDSNLLALSTQQLDLDTQAANLIFAGPTTGGAAKPTFRAMVVADLVSHTHSHDTDLTDVSDSDHHNPVTAGDGIDLTGQQVAVDVTDFIDTAYGLTEATNNIRLNIGDGLEFDTGALEVDLHAIWSGLEFDAGDLRVALGVAFTWTGTHTFQADIQAECDLDFVTAHSITTTAGNLTIAPAGDVIFDPVGNDILPYTGYDLNIGALSKKYLTLHAAELWVETLVAQDTIATIGGRILVGPTTKLTSDLTTVATTIYVEHNQMASGDRVYMEADGKVEFMSIDSAPGGAGPYSYTVTRNLDGSGANQWYAGDALFNTGTTGDGFIDLYSVSGVKSGAGPTIVGNVRNSATYNDWTEHWAIGNLNGLYGYGSDTYGVGLGGYSAADYITIDASNGIRFLDSSDTVQGQLTSAAWTLGEVAANKSNVHITAGKVELRTNTAAALTLNTDGSLIIDKMGDMLFSGADGLLLLGPPLRIEKESSANYWHSTRKQKATITGALHLEAGRWQGTQALVVEPAAGNLCTNPSFEVDLAGWASSIDERSTDWSQKGDYGCKLTSVAANASTYFLLAGVADGESVTVSIYAKADTASIFSLRLYDATNTTTRITENIAGDGSVSRYTASWTNDTGGTVTIWLMVYAVGGSAGSICYYDAAQIEKTAFATSYLDGDQGDGYAWSGTAHASTSARAATVVNLDAHVGLVTGNDTLSFRIVAQMPYDYDATWPQVENFLFFIRGATPNDRIGVVFDSTLNFFELWVTGVLKLCGPAPHFSAGDWLDIVALVDFAADEYVIYIGGERTDIDTTAMAAPTLTDWNLGSDHTGANQAGFGIVGFSVFDRVLTAAEVAQFYNLQRPLIDAGSIDKPGIYILDGQFRLASSQTGVRTEINSAGIFGEDGDGAPTFTLLNEDTTVNSEALTAGDVLLGDNSASKANLLWDESAGDLLFRTGTTVHGELDTAGTFWFGDTSTTERLQWDTTNGLQLFNASNEVVIKFGTSGDALITGKLLSAASPAARIEISDNYIAGYSDATTKEFYLDASDGKAYAGGGAVVLDALGVDIAVTTTEADIRSYKFSSSGTVIGGVYAWAPTGESRIRMRTIALAGKDTYANIQAIALTTKQAVVAISATSAAVSCDITLKADDDGVHRYGAFTGDYFYFTDDIRVGGGIVSGSSAVNPTTGTLVIIDGIVTPGTIAGFASIYVDTADGDLKVRFGDGTIKTIVTD